MTLTYLRARSWHASVTAALLIAAPVSGSPATYDFESGTVPSEFAAGTDAGWVIDAIQPYAGSYSLRNGVAPVFGRAEAALNLTLDRASTVSYAVRVEGFGELDVLLDNVRVVVHDNDPAGWARHAFEVPAGTHTLRFSRRRLSTDDSGGAWIDDVTIAPLLDSETRAGLATLATESTAMQYGSLAGFRVVNLIGDTRPELIGSFRVNGVEYWSVWSWTGQRFEAVHVSGGYAGEQLLDLAAVRRATTPYFAVTTTRGAELYELPSFRLVARRAFATSTSSASVADLDDDGTLEVVYATSQSFNQYVVTAIPFDGGPPLWSFGPVGRIHELVVGDFAMNPGREVLATGMPGHVIGAGGATVWSNPAGFGALSAYDSALFAVGNFDSDPQLEVLTAPGGSRQSLVHDVDQRGAIWTIAGIANLSAVGAVDVDADGVSDALFATLLPEPIRVFSTALRAEINSIPRAPDMLGNVSGFASADLDVDGGNDLVFSAQTFTDKGAFEVHRGGETTVVAEIGGTPERDAHAVDVDADGTLDFVYRMRYPPGSSGRNDFAVLDARTMRPKWRERHTEGGVELEAFDVGQLDLDPALEILTVTEPLVLQVLDGRNGMVERRVEAASPHDTTAVRILDPERALIASVSRLREIRLSDAVVTWESPPFAYPITALHVADIDADGRLEAVILANGTVASYDLSTRLIDFTRAVPGSSTLTVDPRRHEIIVPARNEVLVFDAITEQLARSHLALATVVGAWPARHLGYDLVFASTADGTIELFDSATGLRVARTPTTAPGFGRDASVVPTLAEGGTLRMWGRSDYGVHALGLMIGPAPLFEDSFE